MVLSWIAGAAAATLDVGPGAPFGLPSQAVGVARAGDTVRIAPGIYADCAIIAQDRLTIAGNGPGVVLADKTCGGKAILVARANDVVIRDLTLRGARVPDRNGAGIRAEGGSLTVERVTFSDNENGILAADNPRATILVAGSTFTRNGHCDPVCAHAIYAGRIGILRVQNSTFRETRIGHHIKSRALRTEVLDSAIEDGPTGTASYLIDTPNGGSVLMSRNRLQKGPLASNRSTAILIGGESVTNTGGELRIEGNAFQNDLGQSTVFVANRTPGNALLSGNTFTGSVVPLEGPGTVR